MRRSLKKTMFAAASIVAAAAAAGGAAAFCGFYVAKADTKLFNKASKVAIVRDRDRTVITMANDYQGPLSEFGKSCPAQGTLRLCSMSKSPLRNHVAHVVYQVSSQDAITRNGYTNGSATIQVWSVPSQSAMVTVGDFKSSLG